MLWSRSSFRATHCLPLIVALQVSTSLAYPYHVTGSRDNVQVVSDSSAPTSTGNQTASPTKVIYQVYDGQVQAPYSATSGKPLTSSTTVNPVTGTSIGTPSTSDSSMVSSLSSTAGTSFVSTTSEPCEDTSSVSKSLLPASSTSKVLTKSASVVSSSSSSVTAAPHSTNSGPSITTPVSSIACGQPTPDVYISVSGSVPFVITGVACSPTTSESMVMSTTTAVSTESTVASPTIKPSTSDSKTASPSSVPSMPQSTTSISDSSLMSLTTSAMQTATEPCPTSTSGSVITSLETSGQVSSLPFPTASVTSMVSSLSLVDTSTMTQTKPTSSSLTTDVTATDLFRPVATDAPPAQISQTSSHPVPRLGIQAQTSKLETNKFYGNFYLGSQTAPVFTYPYSISWSAGGGETSSWGLAISHTERSQLAIGAPKPGSDAGRWAYYVNPIGIQSLVMSATELSNGTSLTTDSLEAFSANVNLLAAGASSPTITFPVLQGMSFITGVYSDATPLLQSGIGISSIAYVGAVSTGSTVKYRAMLNDGFTWLIYVTPSSSGYAANTFTLVNPMAAQGQSGFSGTIQIAKLPGNYSSQDETTYDNAAGTYPSAATLSGNVSGETGNYTISWTKQGVQSQKLLMFALPHHVDSFTPDTAAGLTDLELFSTTKGTGSAVVGDAWTLDEPQLPVSIGFAPWSPSQGEVKLVSAEAVGAINAAGLSELSQNITQQTNTGTTYYDGKALAKFAAIVYALNDVSGNTSLALTGLQLLKTAFDSHVNNQIAWPLIYESAWGGVVDSQTYVDGNSGDDFGNAYYNDHHFHYGYFVYTAAVIASLDPTWLSTGTTHDWVNMLVRDYANPSTEDPYFPVSRNFDWYHGHSWAAGLFESFDGKNQESSSEDSMSLYALKLWGAVTGDAALEARGALMMAIQARSLQHYYLLAADNTVQPAPFIGNRAAGIVFDNKIDHTTYFGNDPSYIEGIHMLPIMPFSTLTRTQAFVGEEWASYNWTTGISQVQGGWRGILMANYAIVDPVASYNFFSNATGEFNLGFLDGGASQTWYLAWAAALGGNNGTAISRK